MGKSAKPKSVAMIDVKLAVMRQDYEATDIVSAAEIIWSDASISSDDEQFLQYNEFIDKGASYIALKSPVKSGTALRRDVVIWGDNRNFIQEVLKPSHKAISINGKAFSALLPQNHPVGSKMGIYLRPDERTAKVFGGLYNNVPLKIAQGVRVLKWVEHSKGSLFLTLEVLDAELEALMQAQRVGVLEASTSTSHDIATRNLIAQAAFDALHFKNKKKILDHQPNVKRHIIVYRGAAVERIDNVETTFSKLVQVTNDAMDKAQ
ncbi:hypothetical protein [Sneathiella glossodoripedis]|uniref:hypothetical protein n=1 Tax=Sneathiella glossodoripedis TaxID=418853 RepID=UPI0011DDFD16|nr:hypothetical protein [Sneathiella glossodoripedis]